MSGLWLGQKAAQFDEFLARTLLPDGFDQAC